MPWKKEDGCFLLTVPEGQRGRILILWVMQRGYSEKWSAGIDDAQSCTLEQKLDVFDDTSEAQRWALTRAVEWLKQGIVELTRLIDGAARLGAGQKYTFDPAPAAGHLPE
jgi:hypothetical protein